MAKLTRIGEKTYNDYQKEILELQGEIADLKDNSKRTWYDFAERNKNYFFNSQKISDLDFILFLKQKRLAEAEICRDIFEFNENNSSNQILNPSREWENSNMPDQAKQKIRDYINEYNHPPTSFLFTTTTTGSTMIDYPGDGGGNKKTNSKKYRKSRRKSYKKSHRKYNK